MPSNSAPFVINGVAVSRAAPENTSIDGGRRFKAHYGIYHVISRGRAVGRRQEVFRFSSQRTGAVAHPIAWFFRTVNNNRVVGRWSKRMLSRLISQVCAGRHQFEKLITRINGVTRAVIQVIASHFYPAGGIRQRMVAPVFHHVRFVGKSAGWFSR